MQTLSSTVASPTSGGLPTITVDLVRAAKLSRSILSSFDGLVLAAMERQYRMFLALIAKRPGNAIAPTGPIDEMWHLHMLHPVAYVRDCQAILGYVLDHNPGFGSEEGELLELLDTFAATAAAWEQEFGEAYVQEYPGTQPASPTPSAVATTAIPQGVIMCKDKNEVPEPAPVPAPAPTPQPAPRPQPGPSPAAFGGRLPQGVIMCTDKAQTPEPVPTPKPEPTTEPAPQPTIAPTTNLIGLTSKTGLPQGAVLCDHQPEISLGMHLSSTILVEEHA